jgi:hypothetical protein
MLLSVVGVEGLDQDSCDCVLYELLSLGVLSVLSLIDEYVDQLLRDNVLKDDCVVGVDHDSCDCVL